MPERISEQNTPDLPEDVRNKLEKLRRSRLAALEVHIRNGKPDWFHTNFTTTCRIGEWDRINLTERLKSIQVPVLHTCMIFDHFGIGTLRGFHLHTAPKKLYMVPGNLGFEGDTGDLDFNSIQLEWFDYFLKGQGPAPLTPQVTAFSTGAERWLEFPSWPETQSAVWHLASKDILSNTPSKIDVVLRHDPTTPAVSKGCGKGADFRDFEKQPQCITFTSQPFDHETCILGNPVLRLRLTPKLADANILARLCAVDADGRSRHLNFGACKLSLRDSLTKPSPVVAGATCDVVLECWTISHTFQPGQRLRLVLSLSDYPFFENSEHPGSLTIHSGQLELPKVI